MSYNVYRVSSAGMPRDHHAIFIETNNPAIGCGHIYQVTGNIQGGMLYEDKPTAFPPEHDPSFLGKVLIGTVEAAMHPDTFRRLAALLGALHKAAQLDTESTRSMMIIRITLRNNDYGKAILKYLHDIEVLLKSFCKGDVQNIHIKPNIFSLHLIKRPIWGGIFSQSKEAVTLHV
ncbi:hypothetical protein CIRG_02638 [Coccidioides immitis RMSCC 2394]|uniref:Uncharacterized protein n=1 Tax=Coccidioides immitis RMSCC 2394 TaxID=404692 RepID=A0A0J6Y2S7_COCIT|nr:hypothetical protein CIRG_02638 [Coccidioides immitis RMSCC 2394]